MARIRSIKPEFFAHEGLFDLESSSGLPVRLAFAGLWTVADREGRFKWRPRTIKKDVLPYDDVDFVAVLNAFEGAGFLRRYVVDGEEYGLIPAFNKHQHINTREAQSTIPAPDDACTETHVHARGEWNGREGSKEGDSEANASAAPAAPVVRAVASSESEVFRVGKEVLGANAGGMITRLRKAQHFDDRAALDLIEQARAKDDPREWLGAVLRGDATAATPDHILFPPEAYRNVL